MAKTITFVKRSELPAAVKGKIGTSQITINGNGQIVLSSIATKELNGATHVGVAFTGDDKESQMYVFAPTSKLAKAVKAEEKNLIKLNVSEKSKTVSFSGATILRAMNKYGADGLYEFGKSGNQSFPVIVDAKYEALMITLPVGSLAPKPVVHREKKVKVARGTGVKAEAGSPVQVVEEPTLELEVA